MRQDQKPEVGNSMTETETTTAVHVNDKMKTLAQDFFNNKQKDSDKKESSTKLATRKMSDSSFEITKPSVRKMSDSCYEITKPSARKMSDSSYEITKPSVRQMTDSSFEITKPFLTKLVREASPCSSIPSPSLSQKSSS